MLYSYKNQYPKSIPERITLSNGIKRTDSSTFTEEELNDAGYRLIPNPPLVENSQKVEWNGENWNIIDKNEADKQQEWRLIQEICLKILKDTDFKVIKAYETGIPINPELVIYRQAIRDLFNNVNSVDPWNVVWPIKPELE
jgi:hypothetical protein